MLIWLAYDEIIPNLQLLQNYMQPMFLVGTLSGTDLSKSKTLFKRQSCVLN